MTTPPYVLPLAALLLLVAAVVALVVRSRRRDAAGVPAQAQAQPPAPTQAQQRRHPRLPLRLMTGEQGKVAGASLGGLTSPILFIAMMKLTLPVNATSEQVALYAGLVATAMGSWGTFLVVAVTVLLAGKPDPKVTSAVDRAAAIVAESSSTDREEIARAVRSLAR